ncbi:beta-class carbonic anhydrase [Desulfuribacillus alkaliarsenatis]|uniref:beta-class carbonic anhydrase n=1 Tax=Desulfuribacillus alkaliarsenatis TaxID=766136 RepID=UPI0015B6CA10|nr:carbonic anhydrase [Desulfuribacillus alkaliarsenatis]
MIKKILNHNLQFTSEINANPVEEAVKPSKYPNQQLAIITCMDTRLIGYLESAIGISCGQAKVIKNAGNIVSDQFGETIKSIIISIYELAVKEIIIIGHTDCGMTSITPHSLINKMLARGITADSIESIRTDLTNWVESFHNPTDNIRKAVSLIKNNPFIPNEILVHGLLFSLEKGTVEVIIHDKT